MTSDISLLAGIAAITACWSQIRGLLDRIRGLFIQNTALSGPIAFTVTDYLYSQTRVLRWGDSMIKSSSAWVRPRERVMEVAYEAAAAKPMLAIWHKRPLVFYSPGHPQGQPGSPGQSDFILLTTLRGVVNVPELIRQAIEWQSARETTGRRYRVHQRSGKPQSYRGENGAPGLAAPVSSSPGEGLRPGTRYLHWAEEDIGAPSPAKPFEAYALSEAAEMCRSDFSRWLQLKAWYLQRGIPWRRGHLLYGPPGTGKTALVRALAQEADMPVFTFDLSTLDNAEFRYAWDSMQESAPCIALIEDIDGVFHGRDNILAGKEGMRSSLTFDCLLNALGGIQTADGVFVVITTNKPETLDEALGKPTEQGTSSRPGRIDRVFCLPAPGGDVRSSIIKRICDECHPEDLADTADMTAAQVTEWAIAKALSETWK